MAPPSPTRADPCPCPGDREQLASLRDELQEAKRVQQESMSSAQELRRGQADIKLFLAELRSRSGRNSPSSTAPPRAPDAAGATSAATTSVAGEDVHGVHSQVDFHVRQRHPSSSSRGMPSPARRRSDFGRTVGNDSGMTQRAKSYVQGQHEMKQDHGKWLEDNVINTGVPTRNRFSESLASVEEFHTEAANYLHRRCRHTRHLAHWIIHKMPGFDSLIALVIVANSLTIGLEIQWELDSRNEDDMKVLSMLESAFIAIYSVEIVLRLLADGRSNFHSNWFRLDFFLVSLGILTQWILMPFLSDWKSVELVSQVLILRMLRLLRLVRAMRFLGFFQDLWKLVNGLIGSLRTVASACLLIVGFTFVASCIGVEVITKSSDLTQDPETADIVSSRFNSLPETMLTLLQFSDADSIGDIYGPLIVQSPLLVLYFVAIFIIFTIALMNLVTAVIVEHAIDCSKADQELEGIIMRRKLQALQPQIEKAFKDLDESGNKKISIDELKDLRFHEKALPHELQLLIQPDKLADLFQFLDTDDSGEIDEDEFKAGIAHLALSSTAVETTQILQLLRDSRKGLQALVRHMMLDPTSPTSSTRGNGQAELPEALHRS